MYIAQLFHNVPDVIWSGIIASILTLSGVLIANRSNTSRLERQLTHDREEKAKERTLSMRREVCLNTAEELVKLSYFLGSLPQKDITNCNLGEGFIGFQSASARLQLVAEPRTTLLAMQLSATYGELFLELAQHLMILSQAKSCIKISDELYTKETNEVQRILSAISQQNETGKPDQLISEALQSSFSFHQQQASKHAADRSLAWESFNEGNLAFVRHLLSRTHDIAPQQIKLVMEIRRDLAILGDLSEMEAEMREQLLRMNEKTNQFLQALESKKQ